MALDPDRRPAIVEPRPSAWGGLTDVLDTPAKRGAAIVVAARRRWPSRRWRSAPMRR